MVQFQAQNGQNSTENRQLDYVKLGVLTVVYMKLKWLNSGLRSIGVRTALTEYCFCETECFGEKAQFSQLSEWIVDNSTCHYCGELPLI